MASDPRARILVVDDDPTCLLTLRYYLQDEFEVVGEAHEGAQALARCQDLRPDIVLIDLEMPGMSGLEATKLITERFPNIVTIIQSAHDDGESLRQAMSAGAREYLFKPVQRNELLEVTRRVAREQQRRRTLLAEHVETPGAGTWCFVGGSGGVGQTTLILSIANELVTLGKTVLVVDLNFLFGDVLLQLNLSAAPRNLATLLKEERYREYATMEQHLLTHASGLRVLAPPSDPLAAAEMDEGRAAEIVLALEQHVDYLLVDLPKGLQEHTLTLLDTARFIFIPTSGNLGSVKNARVLLTVFKHLEYPAQKVRPVLVGTSETAPSFEKLGELFTKNGSSLAHVFPRDAAAVDLALYAGQPVTRYAPESLYTQAVRSFLVPLLELPPLVKQPARPPSFWKRLLG